MKNRWLRHKFYSSFTWLAYISAGSLLVFGATAEIDLANFPHRFELFRPSLEWIRGNTGWLTLVCTVLIGVAEFVRRHSGLPWVWEVVDEILNNFCVTSFRQPTGTPEPAHNHRATLFRFYSKYSPRVLLYKLNPFARSVKGGLLIPVARSGHLTQNTQTVFQVSDDGSCEGVAGMAYVANGIVTRHGLNPPVKPEQNPAMIESYASNTGVSVGWISARLCKNLALAKSYCGIPVLKKGNPWGVIVIDSASPDSLRDMSEVNFEQVGHTLSKLIEKV